MNKILTTALFLGKILQVKADVPVACSFSQVAGYIWNFHVSQDKQIVNLHQTKEVCTHFMPNILQQISPDHKFSFEKEDVWQILLADDHTIYANFCPNGDLSKCDKQELGGYWKLIEQHLITVTMDNKMRLITHLKYFLPDGFDQKRDNKLKFNDGKCDETMVGWTQEKIDQPDETAKTTSHPVQCVYGQKHNVSKSNKKATSSKAQRDDTCADEDISFIQDEEQNESQIYFWDEEQDDPEISSTKEMKKVNKKQEKNKLSGKMIFDANSLDAIEKAHYWKSKYDRNDQIKNEDLPTEWDWRNIGGYDFTGNIKDQGECGSCYTFAFAQVINARLRIKYAGVKDYIPEISIQKILSCNYMNEGCEGGQGILNGYFLEKAGFSDEKCATYNIDFPAQGACARYQHCPDIGRVTRSYYLDAEVDKMKPDQYDIMKEIIRNGPVEAAMNTSDKKSLYNSKASFSKPKKVSKKILKIMGQSGKKKFGKYESGVLFQDLIPDREFGIQKSNKPAKSISLAEEHLIVPENGDVSYLQTEVQHATQDTTHLVLIVGWKFDKETQIPYWVVRNSYGDHFGQRGDFYVRRGMDDFGLESNVTGYDVELKE